MSLQHRPLRSSITSIAITGAAALATVLAGSPAMADDATVADPIDTTQAPEEQTPATEAPAVDAPAEDPADTEVTDEVAEPTDPSAAPEDAAAEDEATAEESIEAPAGDARAERMAAEQRAAGGEIVTDFGYRKFRVGVQVADGSFVPEGGTIGSTFEITFTGGEGGTEVITCTTEPRFFDEGADNPDAESVCPGDSDSGFPFPGSQARSVDISDGDENDIQTYFLEPGETATIVQTGAVEGLEASADTAVLSPCETGEESETCGDIFATADVIFDNEGTPPVAVDDSATTDEGEAVDIDLLANDDPSITPITGVEIDDDASNGTVTIDDDGVARYTPDADFSGTDTFAYTLTTQNGSDTATVTVQVEADEVIAPVAEEVDEPREAAAVSSALPNTGGPDLSLLGYGALLLTGGGWLTLRSRRRVGAADRG
ncbi:Ig-like domain-containing protein [Aeromicrobium sp. CF3.5]|uniref:Ig-like domain-containing protein n=1 Tax=Aeromicrobium sp. CF3.5 TaxID=3373078 RepID=UPI003EE5CFBF